jgi:hypothetical protein
MKQLLEIGTPRGNELTRKATRASRDLMVRHGAEDGLLQTLRTKLTAVAAGHTFEARSLVAKPTIGRIVLLAPMSTINNKGA